MNDRTKLIIAAALVAGAVLAAVVEFGPRRAPPAPAPDGGLSLRGKFIGPQAAEDAAAFAGICRGVAEALSADGTRPQPRISTGVQLEDLRVAAAEGRFWPRSLSREQPHATAAAGRYLDEVAGTSGGPLDETARMRWVKALAALAGAAEEAVR
ncbi:MAG: hypothetical protein KGR24_03390 [Planctomycetes bacterium]|nr:hypothetical protein [Planctomycetota bacterium]